MEGDGMIAVVRGLKDSSLCITLMDRNGQYTLMSNSASKAVHSNTQTTGGEEYHHDRKCDSAAQAVDGRYASTYKTTHCNIRPTSPPVESTEFPPQKAEVCRGHDNFVVGGLGSGELKCKPLRTSSYRGGLSWPGRGSVFAARSGAEPCSFAKSLRKYPSISPERSCEIVERLINYSQYKTFQKQQQRLSSKKFEAEIRTDESPTRERARRGDNERRFDGNYDVRYASLRRGGKNSQVTYNNQVFPNIREKINHFSPLQKPNTTASVNRETQAKVSVESTGVSTLPPKTPNVKNGGLFQVALSPLPMSSISEDSFPKLSKSIQTLTANLALHVRKSVQTSFSSIYITGRKLEIGQRRSKSQDDIRNNDFDDEIITLVQDLCSTDCDDRESIRHETLKKLLEMYDSDKNKKFKIKFRKVVNDRLVAKVDYNNISHEISSKDKNSNAFDQKINVFRAELPSKFKDLSLDNIIRDWLKDIPIMRDNSANNVKKEHLIHIVATNFKSIFNNQSKLENEKALRNEILDLINDIPIDIKNYDRKYYLNKLVTKLVKKVKDLITPVSNSKMNLKTNTYGKTIDVYDTVNKERGLTKEDDVRKFVREQLLDFINKFNLKICSESFEELESELHEIILDSFDYIRNGKDDRVKHEILGVVFDLLSISDKQGIYFATNLVSNLKEKYKEIPQLKTRSFVIFKDDINNNQVFMERTNDKDIKSNFKWYTEQVVLKIKEWILEASELNPSDTKTKTAINDLAGDIVDRLKYLDFNPSNKGIDYEIEHLKYQIFKSMNKLVDENKRDIIELAPMLMEKIKSIPVPNITTATIDYETILDPSNENSVVQVLSDQIYGHVPRVHIYNETNRSCPSPNSNNSSNDKNCCHQKPCCDTKPCCSHKRSPDSEEISHSRTKKPGKRTGCECHKTILKNVKKVDFGCSMERCLIPTSKAPGSLAGSIPAGTVVGGSGSTGPIQNASNTSAYMDTGSVTPGATARYDSPVANSTLQESVVSGSMTSGSPMKCNMSVEGQIPGSLQGSSPAGGAMHCGTESTTPDTMRYSNPAANTTLPGSTVPGSKTQGSPKHNMSAPGSMQGGQVDSTMPNFREYDSAVPSCTISGCMTPGSQMPYHMSAPGNTQGGPIDITMPRFRDYEGTIPSGLVSESITPGSPMPHNMNKTGQSTGNILPRGAPPAHSTPIITRPYGSPPDCRVTDSMFPSMTLPSISINTTGQSPSNILHSGAPPAHSTPISTRPYDSPSGCRVTDSMFPSITLPSISMNTTCQSPGNMSPSSNFPSGAPQAHSQQISTTPYGWSEGGGVTDSMSPGTIIPSTSKAYITGTGTGRPPDCSVCVKGPDGSGINTRRYSVPFALHSPTGCQGSTGKRYSSPPALDTISKHPADCRESCCNLPPGFPNQGTSSGMPNTSILLPQSGRSSGRPRTGLKRVSLNAQPIISIISDTSHTVHEMNEDFDQFLENWVQKVPTAENPETAEKARLGIYNGIWMEITKLKLNPDAVNNPVYYQEALDREIDELLDCLPQTDELLRIRNNLKQELLDKAADINQFTSIAVLPSSFKQNLKDNIRNNIPRGLNDVNNCLQEEIINQIAENFIMYMKYKDTDSTKSHVYKIKLLKEIHELVSIANQTQGIDAKSNTDAIIHALERVPIPNDEVINLEADEILLGHEVEQWYFDLPIEPTQDDKKFMARLKLSQMLAKKLHDIEKSNNNNQEMREEIKNFLTKVPIRSDESQNIDFMVDELLNRLKVRPKISDRRSSIGFPDYDEFSKDIPLCSSFHQDHGQSSYMIVDGQRVDQPITRYGQPQNAIPEDQIEWLSLFEASRIPSKMRDLLVNLQPPSCSKTPMHHESASCQASIPGPSNLTLPQSCGCQASIPKPQEKSSCSQTKSPKPQGQSSSCQNSIPQRQGQSSSCQTSIPQHQGQSSGCQTSFPRPQAHSCCQTEETRAPSHMRDLQDVPLGPPCCPAQTPMSTSYQTPFPLESNGPGYSSGHSNHSLRQSGTQAKAVSCCMDRSPRQQQTSEVSQMQYEIPVSGPEPNFTARQSRPDQIRQESLYRDPSPRHDSSNRLRSARKEKTYYKTSRDDDILESSAVEDVATCFKPFIDICERPKKLRRVPCGKRPDIEDSDSENERGQLRMCICMKNPRRRPRPRPYRACDDSDMEYVPLCPLEYRALPPYFY